MLRACCSLAGQAIIPFVDILTSAEPFTFMTPVIKSGVQHGTLSGSIKVRRCVLTSCALNDTTNYCATLATHAHHAKDSCM
ncbi:MAG: hypothetical protein EOO65_05035 [Methanosarcinales archaeon]|nr:MAG: hypothetical protein EOO65_05035 [Methanosarcinales archaeon]